MTSRRGQYLASVAERIGFRYRRLLTPASLSGAMLDARLARREPDAFPLFGRLGIGKAMVSTAATGYAVSANAATAEAPPDN